MSKHTKITRPTLVDPASLWDRLGAEQQAHIGRAAIVIALSDRRDVDQTWNWEAALSEGMQALVSAVEVAGLVDADVAAAPDLAAIGVRMCHACGCTDECGCDEGCSWIAANLCSACEGRP